MKEVSHVLRPSHSVFKWPLMGYRYCMSEGQQGDACNELLKSWKKEYLLDSIVTGDESCFQFYEQETNAK